LRSERSRKKVGLRILWVSLVFMGMSVSLLVFYIVFVEPPFEKANRQRELTELIMRRLSSSPRLMLSVEKPPLEVGSSGRILPEEKLSLGGDASLPLMDHVYCSLSLYHLTQKDVSTPVTGIPLETRAMVVEIVEDSVFLEGVSPGRYRLDVGFYIHPAQYRKDTFDALGVGGRPSPGRDLTWFPPTEWLGRFRGIGVILSNAGEVGEPERLREFAPSEFVEIVVRRWGEAVPARWALLEPFPVAQIHAFDKKGWRHSVGYYRRGSVPERVVVHLYSSEGDLLMSVRTKAIKAGEGEKKP
jgi:hypothetical protein